MVAPVLIVFPRAENLFLPTPRAVRCDIRIVQELFGHKDVAMTQIHTHVMQKPGSGGEESAGSLTMGASEQ